MQNQITHILSPPIVFLVALALGAASIAPYGYCAEVSDTVPLQSAASKLWIEGYSPVSYFTEGKAQLGSKEFQVEHDGKIYYLTSSEQVAIFNKQPDKYRPRYTSCPYSLTLGKTLSLDPTNFKIVGGYLLLFHRSEEMDGLRKWNDSVLSEKELLERADKQFTLLKF